MHCVTGSATSVCIEFEAAAILLTPIAGISQIPLDVSPLFDSNTAPKETDAARAAKFAQKAKQAQEQADHQLVVLVLKSWGSAAVNLAKRLFIQQNMIDIASETVIAPPPNVTTPTLPTTGNSPAEPSSWKSQFGSTWQSSSVKGVRSLLSQISPTILSRALGCPTRCRELREIYVAPRQTSLFPIFNRRGKRGFQSRHLAFFQFSFFNFHMGK